MDLGLHATNFTLTFTPKILRLIAGLHSSAFSLFVKAEADGNGICNAHVEYSGNGNVFANLSFDSMAAVIVGWQLPKRCSVD
ncbi:hypothetical protein NC652_036262 [Populus alba x Populus x berolinensis]|nr:hypothetical protein NC652_036262 [Populus alba x Populus x berolinensis]